jgi:hypothetical protein
MFAGFIFLSFVLHKQFFSIVIICNKSIKQGIYFLHNRHLRAIPYLTRRAQAGQPMSNGIAIASKGAD